MSPERLQALKRRLAKWWFFSPERLWLSSISLHERGHWILAFWVKQLNTFLYHNSLAPGATVSPDVRLGHNSIGVVVSSEVVIGRRVKIWHNVTLSAGRPLRTRQALQADAAPGADGQLRAAVDGGSRIVIEDDVKIGANAVVIAPRGRTLRIGRGARIGAGTVVTQDVPDGGTIVGPPARLLVPEAPVRDSSAAGPSESGHVEP